MDRPRNNINDILLGKHAITPFTALQFERFLGISAERLMQLQAIHLVEAERSRLQQKPANLLRSKLGDFFEYHSTES